MLCRRRCSSPARDSPSVPGASVARGRSGGQLSCAHGAAIVSIAGRGACLGREREQRKGRGARAAGAKRVPPSGAAKPGACSDRLCTRCDDEQAPAAAGSRRHGIGALASPPRRAAGLAPFPAGGAPATAAAQCSAVARAAPHWSPSPRDDAVRAVSEPSGNTCAARKFYIPWPGCTAVRGDACWAPCSDGPRIRSSPGAAQSRGIATYAAVAAPTSGDPCQPRGCLDTLRTGRYPSGPPCIGRTLP